jgi:hypothetical protein
VSGVWNDHLHDVRTPEDVELARSLSRALQEVLERLRLRDRLLAREGIITLDPERYQEHFARNQRSQSLDLIIGAKMTMVRDANTVFSR